MAKQIDYFFSIGSPWSYIGLDPFVEIAQRHDAVVTPYLTTIIEENGGIFGRNRPEVRRAYSNRDLQRWARARGRQLWLDDRPQLADPAPAALLVNATYLDGQDWVGLTRALQKAFWADGADIGDAAVSAKVAGAAGFDSARLLQRTQDEDVAAKSVTDRNHARESGVFGFPTYAYDGEIYWGQDSLPFLQRHLSGDRP